MSKSLTKRNPATLLYTTVRACKQDQRFLFVSFTSLLPLLHLLNFPQSVSNGSRKDHLAAKVPTLPLRWTGALFSFFLLASCPLTSKQGLEGQLEAECGPGGARMSQAKKGLGWVCCPGLARPGIDWQPNLTGRGWDVGRARVGRVWVYPPVLVMAGGAAG